MKTILVTGVTGAIGEAVLTILCSDNHVIGTYKTEPAPRPRFNTEFLHMDIRRQNPGLLNDISKIDALVNCAGVSLPGALMTYDMQEWADTLTVNLTGAFYLSRLVAKHMTAQSIQGSIINVASFGATLPAVGSGVYAASKAALVSLTKSMADEWGKYRIRVNCVSPGTIPSAMTESHIEKHGTELRQSIAMQRLGTAYEVAKVIRFLTLDDSYITGEDIKITGGKFLTQGIGRQ